MSGTSHQACQALPATMVAGTSAFDLSNLQLILERVNDGLNVALPRYLEQSVDD